MKDNDSADRAVDLMLREHGATWRDANRDRPGIDWTAVTQRRRSPKAWIGILAIAGAAAAIVIPLAVLPGSKHAARPSPAHKLPLKIVEQGAPEGFFALAAPDVAGKGGATAYVTGPTNYDSTQPAGLRGVAVGVTPDGLTAYTAYPKSGCRSHFDRNYERPRYKHTGVSGVANLATLPGIVQRTAMAVSPDSTQLAFVVDRAGPSCTHVQRLEVYDMRTKTTATWRTSPSLGLQDLTWAPDSRTLLYQVIPQCVTQTCKGAPATRLGTYALNTDTAKSLLDAKFLLPQQPDRGNDQVLAPVFYWRGQLVAMYNGAVRPVQNQGLGAPIATGFPDEVVTVSVDLTGEHLMLAAAPLITDYGLGKGGFTPDSAYSTDRMIAETTTYRWDRGVLTKLDGRWLQPAW